MWTAITVAINRACPEPAPEGPYEEATDLLAVMPDEDSQVRTDLEAIRRRLAETGEASSLGLPLTKRYSEPACSDSSDLPGHAGKAGQTLLAPCTFLTRQDGHSRHDSPDSGSDDAWSAAIEDTSACVVWQSTPVATASGSPVTG